MNQQLCCPACGQLNDEQALWCESCAHSLAGVIPQPIASLPLVPHFALVDPQTLTPTGGTLPLAQPDVALVLGRTWNSVAPDLDLRPWLQPYVANGARSYGISRRQLVVRRQGRELHILREGAATTAIWLGGQRSRTTILPPNGTWRLVSGDLLILGDPWANPQHRAPGLVLQYEY